MEIPEADKKALGELQQSLNHVKQMQEGKIENNQLKISYMSYSAYPTSEFKKLLKKLVKKYPSLSFFDSRVWPVFCFQALRIRGKLKPVSFSCLRYGLKYWFPVQSAEGSVQHCRGEVYRSLKKSPTERIRSLFLFLNNRCSKSFFFRFREDLGHLVQADRNVVAQLIVNGSPGRCFGEIPSAGDGMLIFKSFNADFGNSA